MSRRTVTVLFCDVVDWTPLGAAVDPEVLRERQTGYHRQARTVLERHGATVEKFIGDAVMAVFGWPAAREDDALRAVRAAAELRDALAELRVRIGINTGEVAAGEGDALVTGDAVNLAKRLEQAADSGSVLVGAATRALVQGAVQLEPLPPVWLKGVRAPVEAWRLGELLGDARQIGRRLDGPFVGRATELDRLRAELEAARGGCRIATVVGAAGLGKSRLAFELGETVSGEARVLTGRCLSYGEGITFWPLEEIVREAGGDPAFLAAHADRVFAETRRFLEELAAVRPLLLVLEDIHWAEPTFLDLLEYLAGWSEAPMLLLCLARSELFERRPDWPRESVLPLAPLDRADAELLVSGLGEELDEGLRRRIAEVAEGNPLFVEQLSAAAGEGQLAIPPTLQALLAARLDRLAEDERAVLERAAVVGRDFSHASVAALAPAELAPRVRSLLLGLVRKEVIRPGGGEDGFAFRHILIREAAYDRVPKRTRAELHAQVADLSPSDELRGYHLERAHGYGAELGTPDPALAARAAAALGAAGSRAHERSDMPAAVNLLERALFLGSADDPAHPGLIHRLALTRLELGDVTGAVEEFELAIREAARTGNRRVEWIARLDAVPHQSRATDLKQVATQAIDVFEADDDHVGLAYAWRRLAVSALTSCLFGDAERAAELALEYARRSGETHQVGRSVDNLCTAVLYGPAPADEAARRCRRLFAEIEGDRLVEASVLSSLVGLEAMLGRFDEARDLAARAHEAFEQLVMRRLQAGLSEIEGEVELLAGDAAAAERAFLRGRALFTGEETSMLVTLLAQAVLLQGRTDEAEQLAVRAEELLGADAVAGRIRLLGVRSALLAGRDEHEAALACARAGVEVASRTDAPSLQGDALAALAQVALDDAAATEALRCYEAKRNRSAADRLRRSLLLEA